MTIKISEVEAKRRAMTGGRWRLIDDRHPQGGIENESMESVLTAVPVGYDSPTLAAGTPDLEGIVATHNAADALIRVVKAALAWRAVRQQNANDALVMSDDEVESSRVERLGRSLDVGRALDEALAEVEL